MQHYPRSTVEVSEWCKKCRRETMHRVDGVKLGPCLVCMEKLKHSSFAPKVKPVQLDMFPDERPDHA